MIHFDDSSIVMVALFLLYRANRSCSSSNLMSIFLSMLNLSNHTMSAGCFVVHMWTHSTKSPVDIVSMLRLTLLVIPYTVAKTMCYVSSISEENF